MRDDDRTLFLERLRELAGSGAGAVTQKEAAARFADLQLTDAQLEQVFSYLQNAGVMILDRDRRKSGFFPETDPEDRLSRLLSEGNLSLPPAEKGHAAAAEYLQELKALTQLSAEEDRQLSDVYLSGDQQAAGQLAQGNLQLVFLITKEYYVNEAVRKEHAPAFYDLIQEGNLGLYTALSRYQGTGGLSFQEYASLWIRQAVLMAIVRSERESVFAGEIAQILNRIREAGDEIAKDLGEAPAASELAQYLDIPSAKLTKALSFAKDSEIQIGTSAVEEEEGVDPQRLEEIRELAVSAIDQLYPLEISVLTYLLGLKDGRSRTFARCAARFRISQERVRRILARAMHRGRSVKRREDGSISQTE